MMLERVNTTDAMLGLEHKVEPIQNAIRGLLERAPGLGSFLHGEWLGHPLHAAVTDLPIGAWSVGTVLDFVGLASAKNGFQDAADTAHIVGLGGAVLAAVSGAADWSETKDEARRVGIVHALSNTIVACLFTGSVICRKTGHRAAGIGLSSAGMMLTMFSAWLGGELAYRYGVGSRREPELEKAKPPVDGRTTADVAM